MLEEFLKGLKRDGDVSKEEAESEDARKGEGSDAGKEWVVVVPEQQGKAGKVDDKLKRSGESDAKVVHAPERDLDHEKNLGTWI